MAGMIGMAQTLAVYHYGYYTLKNRQVQFHSLAREPSDGEAVLEWGLDTPFTSQDKPPLAVAMVVTFNGVHSLWRPGPVNLQFYWSLPLGIWLLLATAWLPCLIAWSVVVLCFLASFCSTAAKAFGPVWGI